MCENKLIEELQNVTKTKFVFCFVLDPDQKILREHLDDF